MAKAVFVQKARKENPVAAVGESYWWWQFRFGPKQYSKTKPRRSQLTQSSFLSQLYHLEDDFDWGSTLADMEDNIQEFINELESLRDECQENLDNIPESLHSGPAAETLQNRIDSLESWIDALRNIDIEKDDDETEEDAVERLSGEIDESNPQIE